MLTQPAASAARLCALGGGIQFIWGAILAVSLQARSIALAGHDDAVRLYAALAAGGALVATLVQVVTGHLADANARQRGDRRIFYTVGVVGAVPALVWFYLAPTYAQLVAAFVALQAALNVATGPYQAIIPDYVESERRGRASAWMGAYQSAGNAAGLLLAGFVHELRVVSLTLAGALVATYATTIAHIARRPLLGAAADAHEGRERLALRGPLGILLLSRGSINVGFFTLLGFLLFFVRDALGVSAAALETQTALLFLTFTLAAVGGSVAAARPSDRYDKRLVVTVAIAVVVGALAALARAQTLPEAYVAATCAGVGWGAFVTADWALATAVLPKRAMATAMGVWNIATTVPQVIAPLATAPLLERLGAAHAGVGARGAIVLAMCEFAAGAAFVWRLPRL
ncbi:MAG: MFS transporter [Vulcanimicrobiaceae bacterium]